MERFIAKVNKSRCVACGVCQKKCPKGAISIYKGCYAVIDENKCIGCGLCARSCPAGVVGEIRVESKGRKTDE